LLRAVFVVKAAHMPDTLTRAIDVELRANLARQHETASLLADVEDEVLALVVRADGLKQRFDVLLDRRLAARVTA
jgi:hypothetical protein